MIAKYSITFVRSLRQVVRKDNANFTHFGVLPFLQYRINSIFHQHSTNVAPTRDQSNLLSVLQDKKSLIMKSNVQSGKSFAMLLHAINSTLSSSPSNDTIEPQGPSVKHLIIVPNNSLLLKYKDWARDLTKEIDSNCVASHVQSDVEGESKVVRVPLNIELIDQNYHSSRISTDATAEDQKEFNPQILIMNSRAFHQRMAGGKKGPNIDQYVNCEFVGIDEADFLISSSLASDHNFNVRQVGKKQKFHLLLNESLKQLRVTKLQEFKRSKTYVPLQYCFLFHSQHPFQHIFLQMGNDESKAKEMAGKSLSAVMKEYNLRKDSADIDDPKVSVVEKMIRMSEEEFSVFNHQQTLISIDEFDKNHFYRHDDKGNVQKRINLAMTLPKKVLPKKPARQITAETDFPDRQSYLAHFAEYAQQFNYQVNNTFKSYLKDRFQVDFHKHGRVQIYKLVMHNIRLFRNLFPDNNEPILFIMPPYVDFKYIAKRVASDEEAGNETLVSYQKFHNIGEVDQDKYSHIPLTSFSSDKKASKVTDYSSKSLQNYFVDKQVGNDDKIPNLLFPSNELPGMDFTGVKNLVLFGAPLVYSQYACGSWEQLTKNMAREAISGIEVPYNDLFYSYLSKLQMDQDEEDRNILIVGDTFTKRNSSKIMPMMIGEDTKRMVESTLLNDIPSLVNYKSFVETKKS